jgi:hypothetical protein
MAGLQPLSDYQPFRSLSGRRPQRWGTDFSNRAWFGGGVVDGLCDVLDEYLSRRMSRPAAIGCVYLLDSPAVIDRLTALDACCIVVDKRSQSPQPLSQLKQCGRPLCNTDISGLEFTAPSEDAHDIGPGMDFPCHEVGPVRVAGHRSRPGVPLLHAKILVLGNLATISMPGDDIHTWRRFVPNAVWQGSANWTAASSSHLENATLCEDEMLVDRATSFVAKVIAFSEPADSEWVSPEPYFEEVGLDNDALAEAAGESIEYEPE